MSFDDSLLLMESGFFSNGVLVPYFNFPSYLLFLLNFKPELKLEWSIMDVFIVWSESVYVLFIFKGFISCFISKVFIALSISFISLCISYFAQFAFSIIFISSAVFFITSFSLTFWSSLWMFSLTELKLIKWFISDF